MVTGFRITGWKRGRMESSIGIILIVYNYGDEGGHNGVSVDKSQTNYTRKISLTFKFF